MDISIILLVITVLAPLILIWLNILATIAIRCDQTLERFQRTAQLIFVWVIPFLGASIVIRIVYEHSPETIPRSWIPWPFKSLIYGLPIKSNPLRDDREPEDVNMRNRSSGSDSSPDGGD